MLQDYFPNKHSVGIIKRESTKHYLSVGCSGKDTLHIQGENADLNLDEDIIKRNNHKLQI